MLRWMYALLRKAEWKATPAATIGKFFGDWLTKEKRRRPYEPLTLVQLKVIATREKVKATGLKKPELITELIKPPSERQKQKSTSRASKDDIDPTIAPVVALLQQAYMRPQKENDRSAAAVGHRNEEPFLKAFFDKCNSNSDFKSFDVKAIYRLGLMQKKRAQLCQS
jgi:hypothetical protein